MLRGGDGIDRPATKSIAGSAARAREKVKDLGRMRKSIRFVTGVGSCWRLGTSSES